MPITLWVSPAGGKGLLDAQPHWVSALAWPERELASLWAGEPLELLLVGRMDGSLGLIEVADASTMQRVELEHCYRKDGEPPTRTADTVHRGRCVSPAGRGVKSRFRK